MFDLIKSIIKEALDHNLKIVRIVMSPPVYAKIWADTASEREAKGEQYPASIMGFPFIVYHLGAGSDYITLECTEHGRDFTVTYGVRILE